MIRIIDVEHGTIATGIRRSADESNWLRNSGTPVRANVILYPDDQPSEELPDDAQIASLAVDPDRIVLSDCFDYVQLVVTATLASGQRVDVTRMVQARAIRTSSRSRARGTVQPLRDGQAELRLEIGGQSAVVPVSVSGLGSPFQPDYSPRCRARDDEVGLQSGHLSWRGTGQERFQAVVCAAMTRLPTCGH